MSLGIMVCVVVGFLYIYIYIYTHILNDMLLSSLEILMSKKMVLLSFSSSIVNFMVGVMLLKIASTSCILVVLFL
jgi:hypothetical protein